ncbi:SDR family NAD(P)-dependent oxidoreductase [Marinobacter salinisoli]|uniref:SDR family NAD(P)-dependent oxidoreductase n=1 Tax=Marinobacter salinisoli TaxID=2769486 RepID=A0ABX7N0D8_9GAMM|nr:SDR family NAD(P)-dependent oxidoreductase [Marinobacter salinisoli]QSP95898.1 SDR family NAD(P)-dependent oxidoreductase [Marinobacter salinisoli]
MRHVVIAGASGAIGGAMAQAILDAVPDSRIVGLCRRPERAAEPLQTSDRVELIPWDAEHPESLTGVTHALESVMPAEQGVDMLLYAAGILHASDMFPEKRLEDLSATAMTRAFAVNATGFAVLVRALLPWFRHRRFKRIAAISAKVGSISDNRLGGWYAYRSSKAALNMLVRTLSVELPRRCKPVACVAMHPGTTESELSAPFGQSLAQLQVHQPADTAANLMTVLEGVSSDDNGRFLSWDGSELPW